MRRDIDHPLVDLIVNLVMFRPKGYEVEGDPPCGA